jgi:hypothetical protein
MKSAVPTEPNSFLSADNPALRTRAGFRKSILLLGIQYLHQPRYGIGDLNLQIQFVRCPQQTIVGSQEYIRSAPFYSLPKAVYREFRLKARLALQECGARNIII